MSFRSVRVWLIVVAVLAGAFPAPAPLVYRPGEGLVYEPVGEEGKWRRDRAEAQLEVAQTAFDKKEFSLALKAARRVVQMWPLSDFAPEAQYLVGRCYEAKGQDEKAFNEYQKVLEKTPKTTRYPEILQRQFEITNRYLAGKWFKLWGVIPFFASMDRTAGMYAKIVKNGPYSEVAPQAQLSIGTAREKEKALGMFKAPDYPAAVQAYKLAADRYFDRPKVAAEALYRAGQAYKQQALTAEYDQTTAGQAISTFTDFMALYPEEPRVPQAQKVIASLKTEQARGYFETAKFYEKRHRWEGAKRYYNASFNADPNSSYAAEAQRRIYVLNQKTLGSPN